MLCQGKSGQDAVCDAARIQKLVLLYSLSARCCKNAPLDSNLIYFWLSHMNHGSLPIVSTIDTSIFGSGCYDHEECKNQSANFHRELSDEAMTYCY